MQSWLDSMHEATPWFITAPNSRLALFRVGESGWTCPLFHHNDIRHDGRVVQCDLFWLCPRGSNPVLNGSIRITTSVNWLPLHNSLTCPCGTRHSPKVFASLRTLAYRDAGLKSLSNSHRTMNQVMALLQTQNFTESRTPWEFVNKFEPSYGIF